MGGSIPKGCDQPLAHGRQTVLRYQRGASPTACLYGLKGNRDQPRARQSRKLRYCWASPSGCNQGNRGRPINRDCDCGQSHCIQAGCCKRVEHWGLSRDFSRNFRGTFCRGKKCLQARKLRDFMEVSPFVATGEIAEGR
jgi:hypothetical protein